MSVRKKTISFISALCIATGICSNVLAAEVEKADMVVYGTIYTSNADQDVVNAIAIKNGKYIYAGDKAGAKPYVDSNTKIIEHKNGMIIAGATEAHGHYVMESMEKLMLPTSADSFAELKADFEAFMKKHPDKAAYVGAGWNRQNDLQPNADINYLAELDKICADKPILLMDTDHHQAVCNTKAFNICFDDKGVSLLDKAKGREDTASIPGAVILRLPDGQDNGYIRDQAVFVAMRKLSGDVISEEDYDNIIQEMQQELYSQGYTNYNDGLTNTKIIDALLKADKEGKIKVNVRPNINILAMNMQDDKSLNASVAAVEKYNKKGANHILPAGIKIFVDGVTETQTGVIDVPYNGTDYYGNSILDEEQIYKLAKAANKKGIGIHSHSYGNVAVNQTINAFIRAQKEVNNGVRNTMAHVMNVLPHDYKRMADNNIGVAENINWHQPMTEAFLETENRPGGTPRSIWLTNYPINSLVKNGVIVASSTDVPAANGHPTDVFGIIEVAVNPIALHWLDNKPELEKEMLRAAGYTKEKLVLSAVLNTDEYISVKEALDVMTINGAKFMEIDKERGSIEVGKYADFILVDKNVLDCPVNEIHTAKVENVYFEGEQVY